MPLVPRRSSSLHRLSPAQAHGHVRSSSASRPRSTPGSVPWVWLFTSPEAAPLLGFRLLQVHFSTKAPARAVTFRSCGFQARSSFARSPCGFHSPADPARSTSAYCHRGAWPLRLRIDRPARASEPPIQISDCRILSAHSAQLALLGLPRSLPPFRISIADLSTLNLDISMIRFAVLSNR